MAYITYLIKTLGFLIAMALVWVPLAVFQGYGLLLLWEWFVVPLGFHALTLPGAMGITLIASLLTANLNGVSTQKDMVLSTMYCFLGQCLLVSTGYIIKSFFMELS